MSLIVYNVTVNVDTMIFDEWYHWMKNEHIPEVLSTGYFSSYKIFKLLTTQEDEGGMTIAVQYTTNDMGKLEKYLADHAPHLREKHHFKFGERALAFRSVLEEI